MPTPDLDPLVLAVQRAFPQVDFACHVRRSSSDLDLSGQDSTYLGHLDRERGTSPRVLARHQGIADSTLSAFVKRVVEHGYVERRVSAEDRREAELRLTARGEEALAAASVLDGERLRAVLAGMESAAWTRAIEGLELLAAGCRAAREAWSRRHANEKEDPPCPED